MDSHELPQVDHYVTEMAGCAPFQSGNMFNAAPIPYVSLRGAIG